MMSLLGLPGMVIGELALSSTLQKPPAPPTGCMPPGALYLSETGENLSDTNILLQLSVLVTLQSVMELESHFCRVSDSFQDDKVQARSQVFGFIFR